MSMFRLRDLFDDTIKVARQRAIEHVRSTHPEYIVGSARLRANESGRHVFAVGYSDPNVHTIPGPYILVAVPKSGGGIEELARTPESPYWIRGLK